MKNWARTPWLGVFIVIVGASLCVPQVAGALPGRTAVKATVAAIPPGCTATITLHKATATMPATATVVSSGCPGAVLVAYKSKSPSFLTAFPEFLFDGPNPHMVKIPPCFFEIDYVTPGPTPAVLLKPGFYGNSHRFITGRQGGKVPCVPATTTTSTTATTVATTIPGRTSSSVLGSTIVNGATTTAAGATTEPADAAVLGTQTLPRTGASHVGIEALMGLGLIALGGCVLAADRRRRRLA